MTATQATDFLSHYTVVDHHPNDASGFSATLTKDNAGVYTLSMRSTEYFNTDKGGDWPRDGLSGADGEISGKGFAFGQLLSMEQYWKDVVQNIVGANKINVTGYSLSGNLATVFTMLHPNAVAGTTLFNSAGIGHIAYGSVPGMTQPQIIQEMLDTFHAKLLTLNPGWDAYAADGTQNIYNNAYYQAARTALLDTSAGGYDPVFSSAEISNGLITQLYGHGAHNDTEIVANSGNHVPAKAIFIEDQPNIQGTGPITWFDSLTGTHSDYGTTHSITLIADSLAVMRVFEHLGMDMSTPQGLTTAYNLLAGSSYEQATGFIGTNGIAESDSLEKAVEALGKLLLGETQFATIVGGAQIPRGTNGGDFGNLDNRTKFYAARDAINQKIDTFVSLNIETLVGDYASTLLQIAEDTSQPGRALAYRYALAKLNPFAITGDDGIYANHNAGGELDLYDPAGGTGTLTQQYLTDRAAMLERKLWFNTEDKLPLNPATTYDVNNHRFENESTCFEDAATGYKINQGGLFDNTRHYFFGSNGDDTHLGALVEDHLYGGAGSDTLTGKAGDDYLEGGTGADLMTGGQDNDFYMVDNPGDQVIEAASEGTDTVQSSIAFTLGANVDNLTLTGSADLAGTGNDLANVITGNSGANQLTGGKGADTLIGGAGNDTYLINPGDGNDTLLDSDGKGHIVYNGTTLTGGAKSSITGDTWRDANGYTYTLNIADTGRDLLIDAGAERITVKDYTSGKLGINLPGAVAPFPDGYTSSGGIIFYGDRIPYWAPNWSVFTYTPFGISGYGAFTPITSYEFTQHLSPYMIQPDRPYSYWSTLFAANTWPYFFHSDGNMARDTGAMFGWPDKVYDTPFDDDIYAGDGYNVVYADRGGNNYVETGANTDYILGGAGRDVVHAGGMCDTVIVAGGNDIVYGQDGGDVIDGGAGDDFLVGGTGAGNNTLPGDGGNGSDAIYGGAGSDKVYGGDPISWADAITDSGIAAAGHGELLAGGGDTDIVVGERTNDALLGGTGQDSIAGREGDDIIMGDSDVDFKAPPLNIFSSIIAAFNWPMGPYVDLVLPNSTAPMLGVQFLKIDHGVGAANRFEVKILSSANADLITAPVASVSCAPAANDCWWRNAA